MQVEDVFAEEYEGMFAGDYEPGEKEQLARLRDLQTFRLERPHLLMAHGDVTFDGNASSSSSSQVQ